MFFCFALILPNIKHADVHVFSFALILPPNMQTCTPQRVILTFLYYVPSMHTTTKHTGVHQEAYTDVYVFFSLTTYQTACFYVNVHLILMLMCNYFPFLCLHLQETYTGISYYRVRNRGGRVVCLFPSGTTCTAQYLVYVRVRVFFLLHNVSFMCYIQYLRGTLFLTRSRPCFACHFLIITGGFFNVSLFPSYVLPRTTCAVHDFVGYMLEHII